MAVVVIYVVHAIRDGSIEDVDPVHVLDRLQQIHDILGRRRVVHVIPLRRVHEDRRAVVNAVPQQVLHVLDRHLPKHICQYTPSVLLRCESWRQHRLNVNMNT